MIKLVFFFNVTVPCVDKNDLDLFLGANNIDNNILFWIGGPLLLTCLPDDLGLILTLNGKNWVFRSSNGQIVELLVTHHVGIPDKFFSKFR